MFYLFSILCKDSKSNLLPLTRKLLPEPLPGYNHMVRCGSRITIQPKITAVASHTKRGTKFLLKDSNHFVDTMHSLLDTVCLHGEITLSLLNVN